LRRPRPWPDSPRALAGRLRRAATFLRKIGIEIGFDREGRARTRIIRITITPQHPVPDYDGARQSAPSAPSALLPKSNQANGFAASDLRTVGIDADDSSQRQLPTVRANSLISKGATAADGADANFDPQSEAIKTGTSTSGWRRGRI
jgi:hypothetical protein